jgi:hypothetical protein
MSDTLADEALAPWTFRHGASWLIENGVVLPIPSFHDEWIRVHQDQVSGCANVCDVVIRKRWVSVMVFSEGYVELLVPGRGDAESLGRAREFLFRAVGDWTHALLMTMDEEGYIRLEPKDVRDPAAFLLRIGAGEGFSL